MCGLEVETMGLLVPKLRGFSRQWSGGSRMGLRRTTRQLVNETTSGAVATCSLVVLWSSSLQSWAVATCSLVVSWSAKR